MSNDTVVLDDSDRAVLGAAVERIGEKMTRLREVVPCVIDMSGREATLAAPYGHTLADKIELYRLAESFGFTDFGLPSFLAFPSVADQFMDYLIDEGVPLDRFFASVAVEPTDADGAIPDSPAGQRIVEAGIPNVILVVEMRPAVIDTIAWAQDRVIADIGRYVAHYRGLVPAETERVGRLYIRLADPFDSLDEDAAFLMRVLKLLGSLPITGILFEDVRGTRFPFESNELVRLMRHYNPPPRKILVHPHSGNGMEDAATLEAILAGADGLWSGFTPQAAQGAHGSVLMFLTNLLRAGNRHVRDAYRLEKTMETAERMWQIHDHAGIPAQHPVVGERAYRYVDRMFEQTDQPCDLDPRLIGREPSYQVMPAWAPPDVIALRLGELGYGPEVTADGGLMRMMRILMNKSQVDGLHVRFDDPGELAKLVERARDAMRAANFVPEAPATQNVLASRYR